MITIKTLNEATAQEVYDQVISHLRKQGEKAGYFDYSNDKFICQYRDENGRKCAAGCLIADNEYSPEMENKIWDPEECYGYVSPWKKLGYNLCQKHDSLIITLQGVHDTYEPDQWEARFKSVAINFGLEYTPI